MSELRASATAASAMLELASPAPAVIAAVTKRGSSCRCRGRLTNPSARLVPAAIEAPAIAATQPTGPV